MRAWWMASALVSSAALASAEDRTVPAFSSVQISAGMHATVTIGPQKPVHLEASPEALALLETVVEDGALQVRFKQHRDWHGDHAVKVALQTPQLHSLGASGGSVVEATFTKADRSAIQSSGGSEIRVRGVEAPQLSVQASGGSVLEIAGSAERLELQLSGGSLLHGHDFSTRDAEVQGSGGSQADLKVSGKLKGGLSGGSQLHITGGASSRVATSGGSFVFTD